MNISYTPDIFGSNRRQVESLEAQAEGQKCELDAAYISLASNVVLAAIGEASLRAQIAATRAIIPLRFRLAGNNSAWRRITSRYFPLMRSHSSG